MMGNNTLNLAGIIGGVCFVVPSLLVLFLALLLNLFLLISWIILSYGFQRLVKDHYYEKLPKTYYGMAKEKTFLIWASFSLLLGSILDIGFGLVDLNFVKAWLQMSGIFGGGAVMIFFLFMLCFWAGPGLDGVE